jgi:hypothetical protein
MGYRKIQRIQAESGQQVKKADIFHFPVWDFGKESVYLADV